MSLTVVGNLAPGTWIPEHRPVFFHSSKVLLLVKFTTGFMGCLGLGQLEETLHQKSLGRDWLSLSFASWHPRLLELSTTPAGVCAMPQRNPARGLQLATGGKECASHWRLKSFNLQGSFPSSEMYLSHVSCDYCASVVSFTVCSVNLWCFGGILDSLTSLPQMTCL